MFELRSSVRLVAGLFLSLSVVSTVIACALWDFPVHNARDNSLYAGGLITAFVFNAGIAVCLMRGLSTLRSRLFLPYIVCSSFHLVVSLSLFGVFVISCADAVANGLPLRDAGYALLFLALSAFWWWSLVVVKAYRDFVREVSGEHILFQNVDFV